MKSPAKPTAAGLARRRRYGTFARGGTIWETANASKCRFGMADSKSLQKSWGSMYSDDELLPGSMTVCFLELNIGFSEALSSFCCFLSLSFCRCSFASALSQTVAAAYR